MKMLLLALTLFSLNSFATTEQCTETLTNMTKLTYTYIDLIKSCKDLETQGQTAGRSYEGYRRIARGVEATQQGARDLCYRVCDDTFFCEGGELTGACSK